MLQNPQYVSILQDGRQGVYLIKKTRNSLYNILSKQWGTR
jgi:hypothetical protein